MNRNLQDYHGFFCAFCYYYRAYYTCALGYFSPLHYGCCVRSEHSSEQYETHACSQWRPSNGVYNRPAPQCKLTRTYPFCYPEA